MPTLLPSIAYFSRANHAALSATVNFGRTKKAKKKAGKQSKTKKKYIKLTKHQKSLFGALLIASPAIALVYAAKFLEDGENPIYRSERVGKDGKIYTMYKFRTMKSSKKQKNFVTEKNDPRVTRLGKLLRHTKFDEVLNLVNVVKGDMSFVGPRAEPPQLYRRVPFLKGQLTVKPGVTSRGSLISPAGYSIEAEEGLKGRRRAFKENGQDIFYWRPSSDFKTMKDTVAYIGKAVLGKAYQRNS